MDPTDPSDFPLALPQGGGEAMRHLDCAPRCPVCQEVFEVPLMVRTCGHSFCSSCIRENLGYQERSGQATCPSCRTPCDARDLLPNVALRDVAEKYAAARPALLQLARSAVQADEQQEAAAAAAAAAEQAVPTRGKKAARATAAAAAQALAEAGSSGEGRAFTRSRSRRAPASASGPARPTPAGAGKRRRGNDEPAQSPGGSDFKSCPGDGASGSSSDEEREEEWPSDSSDEDLPARKRTRSQPKVRGSSQGGGGRRTPQPARPQQQQQQQALAGGDKPSACAPGFVKCPICSKDVPGFYINSHVDECLSRQDGGGGAQTVPKQLQPRNGSSGAGAGPHFREQQQQQQQAAAAAPSGHPFRPLAVPSKLVGHLASEKFLREQLKKYGLPIDGKKSDMVERYNRMRQLVETANDGGRAASYRQLAAVVAREERDRAGGRAAPFAAAAAVPRRQAGPAPGGSDFVAGALPDAGSGGSRDSLIGCSHTELIAATRQRDAARRAARQAAAGAEGAVAAPSAAVGAEPPQQQQQQQQQQEAAPQPPPQQQQQKEAPPKWQEGGWGQLSGPPAAAACGEDDSSSLWDAHLLPLSQRPPPQAGPATAQQQADARQAHVTPGNAAAAEQQRLQDAWQEQHHPNPLPSAASCRQQAVAPLGQYAVAQGVLEDFIPDSQESDEW